MVSFASGSEQVGEPIGEVADLRWSEPRKCRSGDDQVVDRASDEVTDGLHVDRGADTACALFAREVAGHRGGQRFDEAARRGLPFEPVGDGGSVMVRGELDDLRTGQLVLRAVVDDLKLIPDSRGRCSGVVRDVLRTRSGERPAPPWGAGVSLAWGR